MATTLYLRSTGANFGTGNNDANLQGTATAWAIPFALDTTAGAVQSTAGNTSTVAGTTPGVECGGAPPKVWYSPPLDADVTISGSITWNIWAAESNMSANVAINGILEVVDGATGAITEIDRTARTTELPVTTPTAQNFSETPAAGVACKRGDRLRVRVFGDDAGTMASGFTFNVWFNSTVGDTADTWLQLTENLTFVSEPAGTTIYPTDTASDVATAAVDREAWTSRGAGVQNDVTNTVAGWTAPIQVTDTAGGTVVDWFTKPLTAMTLGGAVRVNLRQSKSGSGGVSWVCEIARVEADGTSPTVWALGRNDRSLAGAETALSFLVAGGDLAISDGQRLRIRFAMDDLSSAAMVASGSGTTYYAGTSGGASGDTFLTFTQTLTEFVQQDRVPVSRLYPQLLAH